MKTAGIIAEYNPFHTGHEYQINYIKEKLRTDYVVIAMSGDFVQRGTPALFSKYVRAEMALRSGADLVLELPVSISSASAELFARGGVQLLDGLGVTDILCFGSECGDTDALMELAKILAEEPEAFQDALRRNLKDGMTFPKARSMALSAVFPNQKNTSNCSLPPIIFWELNTVKLFYGKTALFHRFPLNGKEMIITKILCLKITFLLLLLFEMPFWISILHPKGIHPIPSIPTAFYLNHQKPQYRILRFLLIWQKNFYQQIPWNYFYRQFPEIVFFWKTIWTRFTVTVFFRKQKKACAHTWTCPMLLPEGFSPAGISMKPFPSLPTF